MNAKERFYSGLAKETIGKITSNTDNWTSFLRTMSRNYEFTYPEQVMIYAQRPNATFCKPYPYIPQQRFPMLEPDVGNIRTKGLKTPPEQSFRYAPFLQIDFY